ncbi:hypothetical protein GRI69_13595 [Erythrobacter vulgaris]|uniref:Uncharacterized protein n=1 Tax=Qipengyuania vulgaris TaxID=291985 RepID=A0A844XWG2_9SPHN|nr:MFS transporter [Qipengyuania vulgaris]MXO49288.1 hypothetical protein [Qipengyuania vulgaris]
MSVLLDATDKSRRTLRLAVVTAALGVAGMFTAAFTFAGQEAQASEAGPAAVASAER